MAIIKRYAHWTKILLQQVIVFNDANLSQSLLIQNTHHHYPAVLQIKFCVLLFYITTRVLAIEKGSLFRRVASVHFPVVFFAVVYTLLVSEKIRAIG